MPNSATTSFSQLGRIGQLLNHWFEQLAADITGSASPLMAGALAPAASNLYQQPVDTHSAAPKILGRIEPGLSKSDAPRQVLKRLLASATDMEAVWAFLKAYVLQQAKQQQVACSFLCLSVLTDSPIEPDGQLEPQFSYNNSCSHAEQTAQKISLPFVAGGQTVAVFSLGFHQPSQPSENRHEKRRHEGTLIRPCPVPELPLLYNYQEALAQLIYTIILQKRLSLQAENDPLTGLISHTRFRQLYQEVFQQAQEKILPISLLLIDINDIQDINTQYGHPAGDEAIRHVANLIQHQIRGVDILARSGDELMLVLPDFDEANTRWLANRLIKKLACQAPSQGLPYVSVCMGHASLLGKVLPKQLALSPDAFYKKAEEALHAAQYQRFNAKIQATSCVVSAREVADMSEQTVLEAFVSQFSKKYPMGTSSSLVQELMDSIQARISGKQTKQTLFSAGNKPTVVAAANIAEHLMLETIGSLAGALDAKDKYTRGHSQAVANYAIALAKALGLPKDAIEQVRLAGFLHDIGKIGIPESILCKNGPLTEAEWAIMREHPVIGARQILAPVSALKDVIPLVEFHHENWDGSGYPNGLKGTDIPLGARIVAIVDAFHGLTSDRSYRKALPVNEAREVLRADSGIKWDPELLQAFFDLLDGNLPSRTFLEPAEQALALTRSDSAKPIGKLIESTIQQKSLVIQQQPIAQIPSVITVKAPVDESAQGFFEGSSGRSSGAWETPSSEVLPQTALPETRRGLLARSALPSLALLLEEASL